MLHDAQARGVTRLCHLTPHRNFVLIATEKGFQSSAALNAEERQAFEQQDLARYDGHPDHICCSVEFPNAWYYRQKRPSADSPFQTWVVVTINPAHLGRDGALFCHRNAASDWGAHIRGGLEGFEGMYASPVVGAGGRTYRRSATHLLSCPTDNQAEVLIPRSIPLTDVITVALPTEERARFVYAGLEALDAEPERFRFTIVPAFFNAYALSNLISQGRRPEEREWLP